MKNIYLKILIYCQSMINQSTIIKKVVVTLILLLLLLPVRTIAQIYTAQGRLTDRPIEGIRFAEEVRIRKITLYQNGDDDNRFYGFGVTSNILKYQTDQVASDHVFYSAIDANNSRELMRIKGNGRVGIGVSNPLNKFDFAAVGRTGSHPANLSFYATGDVGEFNNGFEFRHTNGTQGIGLGYNTIYATGNSQLLGLASSGTGNILFKTNGVERVTVSGTNGNVGIGTTTPEQKLQVNGNAWIHDLYIGHMNLPGYSGISHKNNGNSTSYGFIQNFDGSRTFLNVSSIAGSYIGFRVGNIDKAVILNNGNMGIGVSNPTNRLAVNGDIAALDYKMVTSVGMPDYVFNSDYKLPTLQETEAYIKANKHLPNFKSAKAMEADGYSLQDMDKGLLQTIEEMTLHSIAQEKKIEEQATQLQKLENEQKSKIKEQSTQLQKLANELSEIKALLQAKR